jgi:hypothetical protein
LIDFQIRELGSSLMQQIKGRFCRCDHSKLVCSFFLILSKTPRKSLFKIFSEK